MLTVCVEAGQGFDAALLQVSRSTTGPVAGEFARVLQEVQIGKPRAEAFSGLSQRTNVPEVKTFVTALVQADRLGLPIGAVLREQSNQMRLVRRQRAGEKAQKVTVEDPLPAAVLHLPGADDRRHRPGRDPVDGHVLQHVSGAPVLVTGARVGDRVAVVEAGLSAGWAPGSP